MWLYFNSYDFPKHVLGGLGPWISIYILPFHIEGLLTNYVSVSISDTEYVHLN